MLKPTALVIPVPSRLIGDHYFRGNLSDSDDPTKCDFCVVGWLAYHTGCPKSWLVDENGAPLVKGHLGKVLGEGYFTMGHYAAKNDTLDSDGRIALLREIVDNSEELVMEDDIEQN